MLLLIAKGKAFSDEAIGCLYTISWFIIGMSLLTAFIKIILHLIFQSRIPPQISFSYYSALMTNWEFLIAGLIVLLFAKAFRRGAELQEEQNLTV